MFNFLISVLFSLLMLVIVGPAYLLLLVPVLFVLVFVGPLAALGVLQVGTVAVLLLVLII
jgi:hypothetical protein